MAITMAIACGQEAREAPRFLGRSSWPWPRRSSLRWTGGAVALAVAMFVLGVGTVLAQSADNAGRFCSATAGELLEACSNEIKHDLSVAEAICTNISGSNERQKCLTDAQKAYREGQQLCGEQQASRANLCDALGEDRYDPLIDPAHFLTPQAAAASPNPFFPLVPGTTWRYQGEGQITTVTVTDKTRKLLGVTCFVVHDVVTEGGAPHEDTEDYYAQDRDGNVWYFGELTQSFEKGRLHDLHGSWVAGEAGGKPGIIMKAAPQVRDIYRQEWAPSLVEDAAVVQSLTASAKVPAASCRHNCIQTREFTPIEPGVEAHKYYAPGIGTILEVELLTGERVELVEFRPGAGGWQH